jgi:hypothetical protein
MSPPSWTGGLPPLGAAAAPPPGPPVTGYALWLDATNASNTNHTWKDGSGNGRDAVNALSVDPVLTSAAVNGLAAYLFAGGNSTDLQTPQWVPTADVTVFAVFQSANTAITQACLIDAGFSSYYALNYSITYGPEYWYSDVDLLTFLSTDTSVHVMTMVFDSSTSTFSAYLDGTLVDSTTTASSPTTSPIPRHVGFFASFTSLTFSGYLCEIIEYDSALGSTDLGLIQAYLAGKWI